MSWSVTGPAWHCAPPWACPENLACPRSMVRCCVAGVVCASTRAREALSRRAHGCASEPQCAPTA
eukprot:14000338-Alexandrium_andersonii.AAC.1